MDGIHNSLMTGQLQQNGFPWTGIQEFGTWLYCFTPPTKKTTLCLDFHHCNTKLLLVLYKGCEDKLIKISKILKHW